TDAIVRDQIYPTFLPAVYGHEGVGEVLSVGPGTLGIEPGDKVILGFNSCGQCLKCLHGAPAYCENFYDKNFSCTRHAGTPPLGISRSFGLWPVHWCWRHLEFSRCRSW